MSGKRVFIAGASGVIGRRLIPQLLQAGHHVTGMTRAQQSARELERLGATTAIADVFDAEGLAAAIEAARPDTVVHQLTDLSLLSDPAHYAEAVTRNARIREVGTYNLVQASLGAGVHRMVAQSIAWAYAHGPTPHGEDDPLDRKAPAPRSISVNGVIALEDTVLRTEGLRGTVLRYGQLYGPGTGAAAPTGASPVHVDAAANAALLAVQRDVTGIFNIAEPNDAVAVGKAVAQLGWDHAYRLASSPAMS
jgi:nucleoside-diphosphate-sugar epimerase